MAVRERGDIVFNGGGQEADRRGEELVNNKLPGKTQNAKKSEAVVVIAGLSRSGKSTALNNIFHTDFNNEYSSYSVTKEVAMRRLLGVESDLILVDTPGFGATDIPISKVRKEFLYSIGSLNFVLIYCYSVGPGNAQCDTHITLAKNLQKVLGKNIWEKCVVFFTFSDQIRSQICERLEDREAYKEIINTHASRLSKLFKDVCGKHVPEVKSVFQVDLNQETISEIVAVPVGLKTSKNKEKYELLPNIQGVNWLTLAQTEVIRKAEKMDRETYLHHVHVAPSKIGTTAGAVIGGVIGAAGGGVLGAATLGLALAPAVAAGTAVGVAIGGVA